MFYEQPLNEQIRLCLRLEYLFTQANHYLSKEHPWDSHQLLRVLLEILQVIERSDLKNRLLQILSQYTQTLSQLENLENIDQQKLHETMAQLDSLIDTLRAKPVKIGQVLRDNDFLTAIQQRLYTPAGTCSFSLPAYHLWLQQPSHVRQQQLQLWLQQFDELQAIVNIILKLLRESTKQKMAVARKGFYHGNLDPSVSYQLIRVKNLSANDFFPEISVGRYRLTIYFFTLTIDGYAYQATDDVDFELACCKM